jgi:predicted MFS family arabinose efflux permease
LDHGAIPAATKELKKDLGLNNAELGKLGSVVFGGLVIGSIFATIVFNELKYKHILAVSYLGNGMGLLIVSQTKNYNLLVFARFLSGFN